jgi:hypothetical protein
VQHRRLVKLPGWLLGLIVGFCAGYGLLVWAQTNTIHPVTEKWNFLNGLQIDGVEVYPGGGGPVGTYVSPQGTPTAGQATEWVDDLTIKGVGTTGTGQYVKDTNPSFAGTVSGTFSGPLTGTVTGNASTASALAANGTNCSAGQAAAGVDASGNAEGCFTPAGGSGGTVLIGGVPTAGQAAEWTDAVTIQGVAVTGTGSYVKHTAPTFSGTVTGGTFSGNLTGNVTGNVTGTVTGNASTASTLAANGANCSAGQFPLGVDASGAVESCTALPTTIAGTVNQIAASASTGAITLSIPTNPTLPGTTTGTFSGPLTGTVTGNASTATALAANGANCTAGQFPLGVDASGVVESCTALPTTITGTALQIAASASTGAITLSIPSSPTLPGTTTGTFSGNLTGNVTGAVTGNASTATALAADGANCTAGQFPLGVDASGAVQSCTALPTTITGTTNQITASAATGAITLSIPTSPTLPGTTTGTFSGNLTGAVTGNASTATALAANGANCSAGQFPLGVDASGAVESCTALPTTITGTANQITASASTGAITLSIPSSAQLSVAKLTNLTTNGLLATSSADGTLIVGAFGKNAQTSTYQVLAADFDAYKTITVASGTFTITLVASGTQPANGKTIRILNYGSGVVTIARSGQNLNGGTTSLTIPAASAIAPTMAVIMSDGTDYFVWVSGGGTNPLAGTTGVVHLMPGGVTLPTSNSAIIDTSENNSRLLFDATTSWCAWWEFRMPPDYTSSPVMKIQYSMTSDAGAHTMAFDVSVMAVTPGDAADANTDSYDTVNNCDDAAIPTTLGYMKEISCALTNNDSLAGRDLVRLKMCRDVATDTATGNAEVLRAALEYTR